MSHDLENDRSVSIGEIFEGKVVRLKPFGAIVELPGKVQGLVHISHVSNKFVQTIEDYLAEGDDVTVKVIAIDAESGKISLSIKDAEEPRPRQASVHQATPGGSFEDMFKDFVKVSNERHAGINKRNKRW